MRHIQPSILLLICLTVFGSLAQGQSTENRIYFLQHSLIFFNGETPQISPNNLVFTDRSICGFSSAVYRSSILRRDSKIRIISIDKTSKYAKLTFESDNKNYEVLLDNSSKKEFEKSFSLVFSERISKVKDKDVTSWKRAIEQFGYPIAKCKDSGVEKWFYILEFSPNACGSFDGCLIVVTKKGIEISGYI